MHKKKKKKPRETGPVSAGPAGDDPPPQSTQAQSQKERRRKHLKNNRHKDFIFFTLNDIPFFYLKNKNLDLFVQPNKSKTKRKWLDRFGCCFFFFSAGRFVCWCGRRSREERRHAWDYGEPLQTLFFLFEIFPILIFWKGKGKIGEREREEKKWMTSLYIYMYSVSRHIKMAPGEQHNNNTTGYSCVYILYTPLHTTTTSSNLFFFYRKTKFVLFLFLFLL